MNQTENGKALANFLKTIEPYIEKKTNTTAGINIVLKPSVFNDRDKFSEICALANQFHAKITTVPLGIMIPSAVINNNGEERLYLSPSDIEPGGPQPRLEINMKDSETIALFESMQAKGQLVDIEVYPSPLNEGKFRVCDGHIRMMIWFSMLQKPGIWAINRQITEQEAFERAFTINYERKSLTKYELGKYLELLQLKYPESYPNQTFLGQKIGVSQQTISLLMTACKEIEAQKPKLSPEVTTRVVELPEHTIREVRKAPEEIKPAILETVAMESLSRTQTKQLVEEVSAVPDANASTVKEKVDLMFKQADDAVKKEKRDMEKLVSGALILVPEELVREAIARTNGENVTQDKLNNYLTTWFGAAYEILKEKGLIDKVFEKANGWQ